MVAALTGETERLRDGVILIGIRQAARIQEMIDVFFLYIEGVITYMYFSI
jgi:hypothetical protein